MRTARVVVVAALVGRAVPAFAFNPQPEPPAFGMVGLARTQTAILNVVLVPVPDDGTPTPDDGRSCRLFLSFVDAHGQVFHDATGNEVKKRVLLRAGVADSLALRSREFLREDERRAPIRAVLQPVPDDGTPSDCRGLVATLEIVGPRGFTRVLYSPVPEDGQPTPDDGAPPVVR